jgi:hypothetical protein
MRMRGLLLQRVRVVPGLRRAVRWCGTTSPPEPQGGREVPLRKQCQLGDPCDPGFRLAWLGFPGGRG